MGLDMYLTKKTYVKNWKHNEKDGVPEWDVSVKWYGKDVEMKNVMYIEQEVLYWRKANAIHGWFVDNVQGGHDNCDHYYVPIEKIEEILAICNQILSNVELKEGKIVDPSICEELLPTKSGFFFGSQHFDKWYYETIKKTRDTLTEELKGDIICEYYYQSSW